ncbi:MAG: phosphoribosylaminoimidazolesuccinocarboxamide synthase [Candidatus Bathyarchaeota archaeon]|nr:phosphoribosylaminoimidazolesuccinocarboxamide synthase [Candidatus Bathyarchaeota archaeon]
MADVILETHLPLPLFKRGKVRDVYDLGDRLMIVSTDRISAFDCVLANGIPCKGEALNRLSLYWFNELTDVIPNHILDVVDPRSVVVKKAEPIKVEFVVRGYLYGSGWEEYKTEGEVCGVELPEGLRQAEKLPQPILTPTTKAEVGHDLKLTSKDVIEIVGEDRFREIEEASFKSYESASRKAELNGIIVADTKFEFGIHDGNVLLIDEVLTPDSSRFWPKDQYEVGRNQPSFDKQYVRDYLISIDWDRQPPAPALPDHVVLETSRKYIEAYERLTGRSFDEQIRPK